MVFFSPRPKRVLTSRKGVLLSLFLLLSFCSCLLSSSHSLSPHATPSLVLMGTAKGGTTDLWHMLHRLHKGFCSYYPSSAVPSSPAEEVNPLDHLQTRKELDFFSDGRDSVCYHHYYYQGGEKRGGVCSANEMEELLRCPNELLSQWIAESVRENSAENLAKRCSEWLQSNHIQRSIYTVTASPSLMYEFQRAALALGAFKSQRQDWPLFVMLLREPVARTKSLYNHWQLQERVSGNGYAINLEELIELELDLLERDIPKRLIMHIKDCLEMKRNFRSIRVSLMKLRTYMEIALNDISQSPIGRVNLRKFGLVLDGFYSLQLLGWLSTGRKRDQFPVADVRRRLLIAQSEVMFADREAFAYDILLPFLHPDFTPSAFNMSDFPQVLPPSLGQANGQAVQNRKHHKIRTAFITNRTATRLREFYKTVPLEDVLLRMQMGKRAVVVPEIGTGNRENWW